mmetsp:Transcript_19866/g.32667  ORF Transcript_19866/g.32667 Transcript_19866/m.32667 type:complete len:456 (+) Transcript_19866:55-1422(+)
MAKTRRSKMPIALPLFRDPAEVEKIRASEKKRFNKDEDLVDRVIQLDCEWRTLQKDLDNAKKEKNIVSKLVGQKKKKKENADVEQEQAKQLNIKVAELAKKVDEVKLALDKELPKVGNLVHESVVVSNDEDKDNEIVNTFGDARSGEGLLPHHQVLWRIDGYEPERGSKAAGHRGYFLKGAGVMLNQALISYALQFLTKKGFTPLQPPYFMNKDVMAGVAQLSQFDEELYHVKGSEGDEKYLIATSEQPLCAYHMGDWLNESELPLKYAGMSTCFRKEAGKHGKDTWGIFRVHQFDKIEMFCITAPDKSWEMHEQMRATAEEFLQSLGLPYQVINIVSGELNLAAAKKYDIEAWFPVYGEYKELVSCSNCLDYQSRAMETRIADTTSKEKKYCHMLNSTLCALTRTLSCIIENFQEQDGVRVPEVLVPFMGGTTFLPYLREAREIKESKTKKGGK